MEGWEVLMEKGRVLVGVGGAGDAIVGEECDRDDDGGQVKWVVGGGWWVVVKNEWEGKQSSDGQ